MNNVLTLYGPVVKPWHVKKARWLLLSVWLMTAVSKDSFESSKAGLFTSNSANKADILGYPVCRNIKKETRLVQMDSQMAWRG